MKTHQECSHDTAGPLVVWKLVWIQTVNPIHLLQMQVFHSTSLTSIATRRLRLSSHLNMSVIFDQDDVISIIGTSLYIDHVSHESAAV